MQLSKLELKLIRRLVNDRLVRMDEEAAKSGIEDPMGIVLNVLSSKLLVMINSYDKEELTNVD